MKTSKIKRKLNKPNIMKYIYVKDLISTKNTWNCIADPKEDCTKSPSFLDDKKAALLRRKFVRLSKLTVYNLIWTIWTDKLLTGIIRLLIYVNNIDSLKF